jgi:hypothetical protein
MRSLGLFYAVVKRDNMEKIYVLRTATRSKNQFINYKIFYYESK